MDLRRMALHHGLTPSAVSTHHGSYCISFLAQGNRSSQHVVLSMGLDLHLSQLEILRTGHPNT